jgi:hypothetical protein
MKMTKLTPVLVVDAIEPCLPFWVDRLGFSKTVEVPHGDRLGFVILARDTIEVMYQTRDSVRDDLGDQADQVPQTTTNVGLYIEVDDLDAIEAALAGVPLVVPRRNTFYGAQEIIVREPAGNTVAFSQFAQVPA